MNLVGTKVEHKKFGTGNVVSQTADYLIVDCDTVMRKFAYPESFGEFLTA